MPTTRTVDSNSSTDVMAKIALSSPGDTVQLLATSATWAANSVSFSGITLKGVCTAEPTLTKGSGTSTSVINVSGTHGQATMAVAKHATQKTIIDGVKFVVDGTHDNDNIVPINNTGAWTGTEPIIYRNCTFDMSVGATIMTHRSPGGLIVSHCSILGSYNSFLLTVEWSSDAASWTTADTFGSRDTTGKLNCYIENNDFRHCANGYIDASDNSRIVQRNNTFYNCGGFNSHGHDSSLYGVRHFEIYSDVHTFDPESALNGGLGELLYPYDSVFIQSYSPNVNWLAWIRGGTGVIYNNSFSNIAGGVWGNKYELGFSIRAIEDDRIQGGPAYLCSSVSYPVPQQLGQSHDGVTAITDPIWMWGNSSFEWAPRFGPSSGWGNPCGFDFFDFFQSGRDYIFSGGDGTGATAKPGYTAFTFPHPLLDAVATTSLNGRSTPQIFI